MLAALGIPREKFYLLQKTTRFKRVFVPDPSFFYDLHLKKLYYTKEFVDLFNHLPQLKCPEDLNIEKFIYPARHLKINAIAMKKRLKTVLKAKDLPLFILKN